MHLDPPRRADCAAPHASRPLPPARPASRATRSLLLGLAVASAFWLLATQAEAACDPDTPPLADGGSVTCTGTDETGFDGSASNDVDVTTSGVTVIDDSGAAAAGIVVGNDGSVTLGVDSTVNVVDTDGVGVLGGDDVDVDLDGTISVNVADGTGVRFGSNTDPTGGTPTIEIQNTGDINLNQDGGVGIDVTDNYDVTNEVGGTITVTGDDGVAMRGVDDTILWNSGTIVLDGDNGRAIQINENTGLPLPNGAISDGTVTVNGANGIVIETGDDTGTLLGGTVDLLGTNGRGLVAGDRSGPEAQANHTNNGTMNVAGDDSIGMELGDGWSAGSLAGSRADVLNDGTMNVSGSNAIGIRVGDDANALGNNNSMTQNSVTGLIDVTGTDAIGISLGGNDLLTTANPAVDDVHSLVNAGTLQGDQDAGPLVLFRTSFGAFENRVLNEITGAITADLTDAGMPNRGIAVQGSDGTERVTNEGSITGDLFLGTGDDFFDNEASATYTGTVFGEGGNDSVINRGAITGDVLLGAGIDFYEQEGAATRTGMVDGGTGTDTARLSNPGASLRVFDVADLVDFEFLEIQADDDALPGWDLQNATGFTGEIRVNLNSSLTQSATLAIGGDLTNLGVLTGDVTTSANDTTIANDGTLDGNLTFGVGDDLFDQTGTLTGTVDMGDGDDTLSFGLDAAIGGFAVGGLGDDTLVLTSNANSAREFDLSRIATFETVRVLGGNAAFTGWEILNGSGFDGLLDITSAGAIEADATTPIALALGGDVTNAGRIGTDLLFGNAGHTLTNATSGRIEGETRFGSGDDVLDNSGFIGANVFLDAGDDTYRHTGGFNNVLDTGVVIDGGTGTDTAELAFNPTSFFTFDLSRITNFETLRLEGDPTAITTTSGWTITDGAGFSGTIEISDGARLGVDTPTSIGGNLLMMDGSSLRLRANPTTTPFTLAGTATFDGELDIFLPATIGDGTFTLVDAAGGRGASTFDTITLPAASGLRTFSTSYTTNGIEFIVMSASGFGDPGIAFTANNQSIGAYLDLIDGDPGTSTALQTELDRLAQTDGSLNNVLSAISPETYDAHSTVVMESGRRVARLLLGRPRNCTPGELDPWQGTTQPVECHARAWAPWVSGVGGFRSRDGFDGHPEYEARMGGIVLGLDAPSIGDFDFTLALSSQTGTLSFQQGGHANLTLAEISGHASWSRGPLRVQGVASWAHTRHESNRSIFYNEGTGGTAVGQALNSERDFNSSRLLLAGEVGLLFDVGPVSIEPMVAIDWMRMETGGFSEDGGGIYRTSVSSREDDVLTTRTGLRLGTAYEYRRYVHRYLEWATGVWRPTVDLRWRQTISGAERDVTASLVDATAAAPGFTVEAEEDDGGFEIGVGIAFVPKYANRLQLQLRYDAYRSDNTVDHDLVGKIRIGF